MTGKELMETLTDKELIKVLKCCTTVGGCGECPILEKCKKHRPIPMGDLANDLIARQQKRIEKLEEELTKEQLRKEMLRITIDEIRIEAIKEFAERLKGKYLKKKGIFIGRLMYADEIDDLVKEMEGEQE